MMLLGLPSPCGCMLNVLRSHSGSQAQRLVVTAAAKKPKPQKKKLRKPKTPIADRIYLDYELDHDEDEDGLERDMVLVPGAKVPNAPSPTDRPSGKTPRPEDLYPVFPKPQQPSVTAITDGKWSWGEGAPDGQAAQQDVPMWNPKTGFMRTREETDKQAAAAAVSSSSNSTSSESSSPQASSSSAASAVSSNSSSSQTGSRLVEPLPPPAATASTQQLPLAAAAAGSMGDDLLAVSREQVLGSCFISSVGMAGVAALLHVFAQQQSAALFGTDQAAVEQLLRIPLGLGNAQNAGFMLAAAAVVTGARLVLMQQWAEFGDATNRSNKQVLSPLGWPDVLLVALLTGVSEEFLFRGGLIPASLPDYRGVVLSGLVFGLLHNSGGRNMAFAAWATVVGWLYGAAFLATGNIWVAAGAHTLANFASGVVWISRNKPSGGIGKQQ